MTREHLMTLFATAAHRMYDVSDIRFQDNRLVVSTREGRTTDRERIRVWSIVFTELHQGSAYDKAHEEANTEVARHKLIWPVLPEPCLWDAEPE